MGPPPLVLTDVRVNRLLTTDAVGGGSVQFGVPALQTLVGARISWHWAVLDHGAPGGVTTSHGAEAIVR